MQKIQFPVNFEFKVSTIANDFTATDADGKTLAYVRQKMFKLKEDIQIYSDESRTKQNYSIKADKWLDFSTAYKFLNEDQKEFGKVVRKGWKSIWKAEYKIFNGSEQEKYNIREENGWIKVLDSILSQVPVLGILTGYLFNPSYIVKDQDEQEIIRLKKMPSFFGRRFELTKLGEMNEEDDDRIMLSLMMMILLERRRG
ncbi:LURP-one-related/scramblase family protein [Marinifilum flexuosum]|uniref:Uncharacterized protein n=1 Tax=Marinifilum flexuosum TaxID=1117708 RepID=A0A419WXM7_9BACT|nr:hypothetical protein [Marinifilum flexuosum]RKE00199.1 hypothetical protein BXY64_3205 [Marinifilum flexuosum]